MAKTSKGLRRTTKDSGPKAATTGGRQESKLNGERLAADETGHAPKKWIKQRRTDKNAPS